MTNGMRWRQRRSQRKLEYCERFGFVFGVWPSRAWTRELLDQLDRCADDSARRLLLERGERMESNAE